jgi:hypothetical protein
MPHRVLLKQGVQFVGDELIAVHGQHYVHGNGNIKKTLARPGGVFQQYKLPIANEADPWDSLYPKAYKRQ